MSDTKHCPVCRNAEAGSYRSLRGVGRMFAGECTICGRFSADFPAFNWLVAVGVEREITKAQRALISHRLRSMQERTEMFTITDEWLEHLISELTLPSPIVQAESMIRFIGDEISRLGTDLEVLPDELYATIGAPSYQRAIDLAIELGERGILRLNSKGGAGTAGNPPRTYSLPTEINLTLDGWKRYEDEKRGLFAGKYGFVAMQFGENHLDSFINRTVKPAVKHSLGYDLIDMRDVARAGVIDNIMRLQIRDAAFMIVDLTHDNPGAYWEAGFAEGLGKIVVYICEREKFDRDKTHFDTNHCTTVPWSLHEKDRCCKELIATLRRSLDGSS